jgi:hypothetical protein
MFIVTYLSASATHSTSLYSVFGRQIICVIPKFALSMVVGIVTRLRTGRSGVQILTVTRFFFSPNTSISVLEPTQPPIQWVFSVVKRRGHKVNHSPPSSAEVKNEWSYTSRPPICHHGVDKETYVLTYFYCLPTIFCITFNSLICPTSETSLRISHFPCACIFPGR